MKLVYDYINYERTTVAYCSHCGNKIAMIVKNAMSETYKTNSGSTAKKSNPQFLMGYCPECGYPLIQDMYNNKTIPTARCFEKIEHLPKDVETLYNEIRDAYSAGAYTCCVIAGRTLLANIAVEQGAEENKSFVYYVDYMVENFLPKSNSRPWVDKVRQLGNDSAHKYVIAEQEKAKLSIKFLEAILKNVYEFPNSIEEE